MIINLRPILETDLQALYGWRNDSFIMARTRQQEKLEWRTHLEWWENLNPDKDVMRVIDVVDEYRAPITSIGICGITNIDWISRSGELSIYIGDKEYRGRGVGILIMQELKRIFFDNLNLRRFWAEVYGFNTPMMRLMEKTGFRYDGVLTATVWKDGAYQNSHFYYFMQEIHV